MTRMPGADWRPVRNFTKDGQEEVRGVVVHIMAGTLEGSQSWFDNPTAQASSHFGTGKAGALRQWVDTKDRAWAQAAGNRTWLSVENEGVGGDALTDDQLDRNAEVLAWAHKEYDVPLQVASGTDGRGLGWHAMGGSAWGGHTSCPGARIVAQLPEIVARAKRIVSGQPAAPTVIEEDPMPAPEVLAETSATHTDVPAGRWTLIAMAKDSALLQGPCTYSVTAYATVTGAPGTRVTGRFQDLTLATKRPSLDLPMHAGTIGPDGRLDLALSRPGKLAAGEQLKLELLADHPLTVTYRVLRGLVWR